MSQALQVYDLNAQNMHGAQLQSQCGYGCLPYGLGSGYVQQIVALRPGAYELVIEKIGDQIHLDLRKRAPAFDGGTREGNETARSNLNS